MKETGEFGQYVGRLPQALTRAEERAVARELAAAERELVDALGAIEEVRREMAAIAQALRAGALVLSDVLRNVERDPEPARAQRRRLLRALERVAREPLTARSIDALAELRLHADVLDRLEGAACRADEASSTRIREARARIVRAKHQLVEHNVRIVFLVALPYRGRGLPFRDLVQEGCLGLMHAVDKFEPQRDLRLTTYASWWVKQSIERALADSGRTIRVPVHLLETKRKVSRLQSRHLTTRGAQPTPREIAERTGIAIGKVENVLALPRQPLSFETPVGPEDGDLRLVDVLASQGPLPDEAASERERARSARALLSALGDKEQRVIRLRFGLDGSASKTLEEIGRSMSLTRERIRQIEASALKKLRARSAEGRQRSRAAPMADHHQAVKRPST